MKNDVFQVTEEWVMTLNTKALPHPSCSSDHAPSGRYLFKPLQFYLEGKQFINCEQAENALGFSWLRNLKIFTLE